MRILIVYFDLVDTVGGAQKVRCNLANSLSEYSCKVDILTDGQKDKNPYFQLNSSVSLKNIDEFSHGILSDTVYELLKFSGRVFNKIFRHTIFARLGWWCRYFGLHRKLSKAITQLDKTEHLDAIICFLPHTFVAVMHAMPGMRERVIFSTHNSPKHDFGDNPKRYDQNRFDIYLRRRFLSSAKAIVILQEEFYDELGRYLPHPSKNLVTIPNALPNVWHKSPVNFQPRDKIILCVGRKAPQKNHLFLARCWAKYSNRLPGWKLIFLGPSDDQELTNFIEKQPDNSNIEVHDPMKNVLAWYDRSYMLAMPSEHEGLPMVLLESMSRGPPIVAFEETPGVSALVKKSGTGQLAPRKSGDTELSFFETMESLCKNPDIWKSCHAMALSSSKKYTNDIVTKQWLSLIQTPHGEINSNNHFDVE